MKKTILTLMTACLSVFVAQAHSVEKLNAPNPRVNDNFQLIKDIQIYSPAQLQKMAVEKAQVLDAEMTGVSLDASNGKAPYLAWDQIQQVQNVQYALLQDHLLTAYRMIS